MRNGLRRFISTVLISAMITSSIPVSAYGVTTQADFLKGITDSNFSPVIDPGREIELNASEPSQSERNIVDFSGHDHARISSDSQDSVFTVGEPSSPENHVIGDTINPDPFLDDEDGTIEKDSENTENIELTAGEEAISEDSKGASSTLPDNTYTITGTKVSFTLSGTKVTFSGSGTIPGGWFAGYSNTIKTVVIKSGSSVVIGDYAFADMDKISSVTISSSGTSIGEYAFLRCSGLQSISIPSKITKVKVGAFALCTNLSSVTMTSSTNTIGDYAFYGCKNLKTISMSGVQTIGSYAFEYCTSLESVSLPNALTIGDEAFLGCAGLNTISLSAVKTLGNAVFAICTSLESVSLPNTLTKTGGDTFNGCKNLKTVTLSSSLNEVGDYDFNFCTSLPSINIPNSVTCLGEGAFYGCSSLKTVTFPDTYVTVGAYCFSLCNNLEPTDQAVKLGSVGNEAFYGTKLLRYIVFSPDSARAGDQAFADNSSLETVDFNGGQKIIGRYAFYQCDSITSFTNMPAFTYVGEAAFYECKAITDVTIAASCENIMPGAFFYCENLTSVNFSGAGASLGYRAFAGCTSLRSITGQQSLSALDDYCFEFCDKLTGVSGFDSLSRIGCGVFYGCTGIMTAVLPEGLKEISDYSFFDCESLKTISLPNSLEKIGGYSFTVCSSLSSVSIPSAVSEIGEAAFAECDSLTSVSLPSSLTRVESMVFAQCDNLGSVIGGNGVAFVGERAFSFCQKLESTAFTSSLYEVGSTAFYGCERLSNIGNTSGLAVIGDRAFYGCASLTGFNASGASSVGEYAFYDCTGLENISFSKLSEPLGESAFSGCISLKSVQIGGSLDRIEAESFCDCVVLQNVFLSETIVSIGDCAFYGCESLKSFSFPSSLEEIGKGTFYNCSRLSNADIPNSVRKIGGSCFYGCKELSSVHLSDNLESIEDGTFYECTGLMSVQLPDNIEYIGYASFSGCSNLDSISVPEGVSSIGDYAFAFCEKAASITLPSAIDSIGDGVFANCSSLTTVTLPRGLTVISNGLFYQCSSLNDVHFLGTITGIGSCAFQDCTGLSNLFLSGGIPTVIGENAFNNVPDSVLLKYSPVYKGWTSPEWEGPDGRIYRTQKLKADMSGSLGSINWSYHMDAGALMLSGSGEMEDFLTEYDVPWYTFKQEIKVVRIEDGITSVGSRAFSGCTDLQSVEMPDSVVLLGEYAFSECSSLTYIRLSSSLQSIGNSAFYECTELADLTMPNSLTEIGSYAFFGCSGLVSLSLPDSISVVGEGAFYDCSGLSELFLSSNVSKIEAFSFQGCSALKSVVASGEVEEIGKLAFANCKDLSYVVILGNHTVLKNGAFYGCEGLEGLYFSNIPESIESSAFKKVNTNATFYSFQANEGTSELSDASGFSISCSTIAPDMQGSCGNNSEWKYFERPGLLIVSGNGNIIDSEMGDSPWASASNSIRVASISSGITSIGRNAFAGCCALKHVSIPEDLRSIGENAFADCESLQHIMIPDSVVELGKSAFYHCASLNDIELSSEMNAVPDYAFALCENLVNISLGTGIRNIGYSSFYGCGALSEIELPSGLTQIGEWSFARCGSLESVSGSETVNEMGDHAFYSCESLTSFEFSSKISEIPAFAFAGTALSSAFLPSSIKKIGEHAFWGSALKELDLGSTEEIGEAAFYATGLESVTIPASVTQITSYAFGNCAALSEIVVDGGNGSLKSQDGVLYTADKKQLIQYPSGKSGAAFMIPDGVEDVGKGAFYACPLSSIVLPDTVKSIGEAAFSRCRSLETVVFSEQISMIPVGCFAECPVLKEVRFTSSLREIWDDAFYQCAMLTDAFFTGDAPTKIGKDAFSGVNEAFSISYAKNMSGWSAGKWTGPDGVTYITKAVDAHPDRYQVTLHTNGGTINKGNITAYTYGIGGSLPTDVTKIGYIFSGWYNNPGLSGSPVESISIRDKGDLDFYAKWENKKYTVTLNTNGGTINNGNITGYIYGTGQSLPDDVTKENYTFAGWYDNAEFTGNRISRIQATETGDLEFFAKWIGNTYTVTLHTNGGTIQGGAINGYSYGNEVLLPVDIRRSGYRFTGWYSDPEMGGEPVTVIGSTSKGDLEFYAGWVKRPADGEIRIIRQDYYPESERIRCEINIEKDTPVPDGEGVMLYAASYSPDGQLMAVSSNEIHLEEEGSYTTGFSVAGGSIVEGRTKFKVFLLSKKDSTPLLPELTVTSSYSLYGRTECGIIIGEDPDLSISENEESGETDSHSANASESSEEDTISDEEVIGVNDDETEAGEAAGKKESVQDVAESDTESDAVEQEEIKEKAKAGTAENGDQINVIAGMDSESFRKILSSAQAGRTSGFNLSVRMEYGDLQAEEQLSSDIDISGFDSCYGYNSNGIVIQSYQFADEVVSDKRLWMPHEYADVRIAAKTRMLVNKESKKLTKAMVNTPSVGRHASELWLDSNKILSVLPVSFDSLPEEALFDKLSEDIYGLLVPYGSMSALFEFDAKNLAEGILRSEVLQKLLDTENEVPEGIHNYQISFYINGLGSTDSPLFQIRITTEDVNHNIEDVELVSTGTLSEIVSDTAYEPIDLYEEAEISENLPLSISEISQDKGGKGNVTIRITGTAMEASAEVFLKNGSTEYKAVDHYYYGHDKIYATFDLSNAKNGKYDLVIRQRDKEAVLQQCFEVVNFKKGKIEKGKITKNDIKKNINKKAKKGKEYSGSFTYTNKGYTDVYAPVILIKSDKYKLKETEDGETFKEKSVILINQEGLPGIVAPGETASYNFIYKATASGDKKKPEIYLWSDYNDPINDVPNLKKDSSGSKILLSNLYKIAGDTPKKFAGSIAKMACAMSALGEDCITLDSMQNAYLADAQASLIGSTLVSRTDLVSRELSLSRYYYTNVIAHQKEGLFGKGWFSNYDVTAEHNTKDGDSIVITTANGISTYTLEDGIYREIIYGLSTAELSGNEIIVHNQDGSSIEFDSKGKLYRSIDEHGNYVELHYSSKGNLSEAISSNGDKLLFSYENGNLKRVQSAVTGDSIEYAFKDGRLIRAADMYGEETYDYDLKSKNGKKWILTKTAFANGASVKFGYDDLGRLTQIDNGEGKISYDYLGLNTIRMTDAAGNTAKMYFNAAGKLSRAIDFTGMMQENFYSDYLLNEGISYGFFHKTNIAYDDRFNVTKISDAAGGDIKYTYDDKGNLTSVTDQGGLRTGYNRSSIGDLQKMVYADGKYESFQYDAKGNVISATKRDGTRVEYQYDEYNQLVQVNYPDGQYVVYSYDQKGNVIEIIENGTSTRMGYTERGELKYIEYPGLKRVSYEYDQSGNMTKMSVDDNEYKIDYSYSYDSFNRLKEVYIGNILTQSYSYNPDGTLCREDNYNGTYTEYFYSLGRLSGIKNCKSDNTVMSFFEYSYDDLGNICAIKEKSGEWTYSYDRLGQLLSAVSPAGEKVTYSYDRSGNRISMVKGGKTTSYNANDLNQYTSFGNVSRSYDANGNVISQTDASGMTTYEYDYMERLVKITKPDESVTRYSYDVFGYRNAVGVQEAGSETETVTEYVNTPTGSGSVIASFQGGNAQYFIQGMGLAGRIDFDKAKDTMLLYSYAYNHLGSTTEITDEEQNVVNSYTYDQEGKVISSTEGIENSLKYVGKYGIVDDNNGLYYVRARYLSSETMSFTSMDPIRQNSDLNVYRYVINNYCCYIDITGKEVSLPKGMLYNGQKMLGQSSGSFTPQTGAAAAEDVSVFVSEGYITEAKAAQIITNAEGMAALEKAQIELGARSAVSSLRGLSTRIIIPIATSAAAWWGSLPPIGKFNVYVVGAVIIGTTIYIIYKQISYEDNSNKYALINDMLPDMSYNAYMSISGQVDSAVTINSRNLLNIANASTNYGYSYSYYMEGGDVVINWDHNSNGANNIYFGYT